MPEINPIIYLLSLISSCRLIIFTGAFLMSYSHGKLSTYTAFLPEINQTVCLYSPPNSCADEKKEYVPQ